jgi:hypothetical protein
MQHPTHQAELQHLAHLRQEDSDRQRQALTVVQALERDRLDLHRAALTQVALEAYLQQQLQEKK